MSLIGFVTGDRCIGSVPGDFVVSEDKLGHLHAGKECIVGNFLSAALINVAVPEVGILHEKGIRLTSRQAFHENDTAIKL